MIHILFDTPKFKYDFFTRYWGEEVNEIFSTPPNKRLENQNILRWINGCIKALMVSKRQDTIVCWFDFQAVMCYWFGLFMLHPRRIVCINVMLKDKNTLRNKVVGWMYKKALESKRFSASVTSKEYGEWLNRRFATNHTFHLVRDVYHDDYDFKINTPKQDCVFCGGNNGRDWPFICEVARMLPDVKFNCVMPAKVYENLLENSVGGIPGNVNVRCNIPYGEFLTEMCSAKIVALPLTTIAPAGLIVMFQAAANGCFVMMTNTATTRGYIDNSRGSLLPKEPSAWAKEISHILSHDDEREKKAKALKYFLITECSEENYVKAVKQMI